MPVIFATGAPTVSGHIYADIFGKQYEFPERYKSMVSSGDRFIYYRGRRGSDVNQPGYLGVGIVGDVLPSVPGRFIATVHDVELFPEPVAIKNAAGIYLETGSSVGTNWVNGVRRLDDASIERIEKAAIPALAGVTALTTAPSPAPANPLVERYAVEVALSILLAEFGADHVNEMPVNNPGFDILVARPGSDLHVEVKGTVLPDPVFHLSEGQRLHAEVLGADFRLIVVHGVQLAAKKHQVVQVEGPLTVDKVELTPSAWRGQVVAASAEP